MRNQLSRLTSVSPRVAVGAGAILLPAFVILGAWPTTPDAQNGGYSKQQLPYSVEFFVPPLPSHGHGREQPISEWSYLDDTDSIFVVLRGTSLDDTVSTTVGVYVQRIPWEGEVANLPDSIAADTIGRWIRWTQSAPKRAGEMRSAFGGRLLSLLHPTSIQRGSRLALKQGRFVTKIRVCVKVNGRDLPKGEIRLLHSS